MKKYLSLLLPILCSVALKAQTTSISATITDSDSQTWNYGVWKIDFVTNPAYPLESQYKVSGSPVSTSVLHQQGQLSSGGAFSATIYNSSLTTPAGSLWQITICPQASSACGVYLFASSGSSMNLTTNLSAAVKAPRFNAVAGTYGYNDSEAMLTFPVGATYWNSVLACQRLYNVNTASWACNSGGGGGGVSGSGTTEKLAIWTGSPGPSTSLGDSPLTYTVNTNVESSYPLIAPVLTSLAQVNGVDFIPSSTPYVDIRSAGALVNGTHDDSAAITAAIAVAQAINGAVYFPPGTALATQQFSIPSNIHIMGSGTSSILNESQGSGILSAFNLNGVSNVEIDNLTIQCSTSPATCKTGIWSNYSNHLKFHDLTISGGGAVSYSAPSGIFLQTVDDVSIKDDRFVNNGGGSGYDIVSGGNTSTRINIDHIVTDSDNADISVGLFDCQHCIVTNSFINQGNNDDGITTCCGYGVMGYSQHITQAISSVSGSGLITFTVPEVGGVSVLPTIGTTFEAVIGGITGTTGNFNGLFQGTVTSATTFTVNIPGSNASGAVLSHTFTGTLTSGSGVVTSISSFSGLDPYEPLTGTGTSNNAVFSLNPTSSTMELVLDAGLNGTQTMTGTAFVLYLNSHMVISNNHIINTAGSAIYLAAVNDSVISSNTLENVVQQESDGSLPAAAISTNGNNNVVISDNTINNSPQMGIEVAEAANVTINGGSIYNVQNGIYVRGGSLGDQHISIGGGITIDTVAYCFKLAGTTQSKISFGTCSNFTNAGINDSLIDQENSDIQFDGGKIISNNNLPCVIDNQNRITYTNIECTGGYFAIEGANTTFNNPKVYNLTSGEAFLLSGAQHIHINNPFVDTAPTGILTVQEGGVQPGDIWVRDFNFTNIANDFMFDQSPGNGFTGNTHGTTTIDNISDTSDLLVGGIIGDYSTGGSSVIPPGTTILSITNTGCPAGCSITMSAAATGTVTGDGLEIWQTVANGVHLISGTALGPSATDRCILSNAIQNLDIESLNCTGFSTGSASLVGFIGVTSNASITQSTLVSQGSTGASGLSVGGAASNISATYNNIYGTDQYSISDISTNTGNYYANNTLGSPINITDTHSSFSATSAISGTGTPSSGLCTSKNQNMEYIQTDATAGQNIWVCSGGSWVHQTGYVVLVGSLTTTASTSDNLTITGMTSSGHCALFATNASAATNVATTYISAKTTNQITVTHTATASMTYDFVCTPF